MKRSEFLQPLSREHHAALSLARFCERAAQSGDPARVREACEHVAADLSGEIERHFQDEERDVLPLLQGTEKTQPLVERTLEDHRRLRSLLGDLQRNDIEALGSFGGWLLAHVRFEERVLFPAIEAFLPPCSGGPSGQ
ncbi:MAG: hemerythrin domain-containing protein [Betaproteobacteria bacterium]|nr:hemerythrin domain-containing protein [Betaproteobacteria bacterium]